MNLDLRSLLQRERFAQLQGRGSEFSHSTPLEKRLNLPCYMIDADDWNLAL